MSIVAQDRPVLVAGGGIGGLSAAIALARRGIPSRVFEAEQAFSESGAGIQIGPNGSRILRAWGLASALETEAAKPSHLLISDGRSGRPLAYLPLGREAESRYGAPYYVVERRRLHSSLAGHAAHYPEIGITTGFRVASFRRLPDGIAVVSSDGREVMGRALIGADGIYSRIRMLMFGVSPVYSGRNAWRATAACGESAESIAAVCLWLGHKAHFVHYPCNPAGLINAVAIAGGQPASPGWGVKGDKLELVSAFADWAPEPWRFVRLFESWTTWPLLDMTPLPRWSEGRVTLMGDAAHPLMPFLASGAIMAIEDADTLAGCLARDPQDPEAAFRDYEAQRIPRVRRVRSGSATMGAIYHMGGVMRSARNLALELMPPRLLLARNDWLYGYRTEGGPI